jgi:hypothetical protein
VLHLDARVHLQEVGVPVLVDQELERARVAVADALHERDRRGAHARAQLGRDEGRRALLHDLLVPALDRALALEEVDRVAVVVGEHLDLDVARLQDRALQVDAVVAERVLRLAPRALGGRLQLRRVLHQAHALAAAAGGRLQHEREADARRLAGDRLRARDRLQRARHHRHARLDRQAPGGGLLAHERDGLAPGADEGEAGLLAGAGEVGVLGQEAVARVHGVGARAGGRLQDAVDPQVRLARRRGADRVGLVGAPDVEGRAVRVRVDGDGGDAEVAAGADHAHGDLAAVRDQDLAEGARARHQQLVTAGCCRASSEGSGRAWCASSGGPR